MSVSPMVCRMEKNIKIELPGPSPSLTSPTHTSIDGVTQGPQMIAAIEPMAGCRVQRSGGPYYQVEQCGYFHSPTLGANPTQVEGRLVVAVREELRNTPRQINKFFGGKRRSYLIGSKIFRRAPPRPAKSA